MKHGWFAGIAFLTIWACSGGRTEVPGTMPSLCGPVSLQIALRDQGVSATLNELCSLSGYDSLHGATMLGLHDAAREKGVAVAPVRIELDALCGVRKKSIVFVDENHFLVFCGCSRERVKLEDPFRGKYDQSKADFLRRWNGEALLFGKEAETALKAARTRAQSTASGPRIQFDRTRHAFGSVAEASVLTCTFPFRNTGSDTLMVKVRSGCGCAEATVSDTQVPPGMSGSVRVAFTAEDRTGFTSQRVDVRTNDPQQPLLALTVTADIRGVVKLAPDRLWIDTVGCNEAHTREVLVLDPGDGKLAIERVEATDGLTASVLPAKTGKDGRRVIPVLVKITGKQAGAFEEKITVFTNDRQRPELSLPVAGQIRTELSALPPGAFFGAVHPDSVSVRELIISDGKGKGANIGRLRAGTHDRRVSLDLVPMDSGTRYKLVARVAGLRPGASIRDSILVFRENASRPVLRIPLFALASE